MKYTEQTATEVQMNAILPRDKCVRFYDAYGGNSMTILRDLEPGTLCLMSDDGRLLIRDYVVIREYTDGSLRPQCNVLISLIPFGTLGAVDEEP